MKRRILILLALIGFLAVLMPKQPVLALCDCYPAFAECLGDAVSANESCLDAADDQWRDCMSTSPSSACDDAWFMAAGACDNTFMISEGVCDAVLSSCLSGCGGGEGGGGSVCNEDEQMGYQIMYVSYFAEPLDACISDGGSAFTAYGWSHDTYDTCMSSLNNPELCCRAQVKNLLDTYATCNISQHHPLGCKHCVGF